MTKDGESVTDQGLFLPPKYLSLSQVPDGIYIFSFLFPSFHVFLSAHLATMVPRSANEMEVYVKLGREVDGCFSFSLFTNPSHSLFHSFFFPIISSLFFVLFF